MSRINIENNYASLSFNPRTFETLKDLTIYARDRDEHKQLFGILLYDKRGDQSSVTITAQSGRISVENKSALLHMENGTVQRFNYNSQETDILNFDNYVFNLTENQKSDVKLRWKTGELYLHELFYPEEELDEEEAKKYRVEINQRFVYPLLPIIFSLIAISFILRGQFNRHGNMPNTVIAISVAAIFLGLIITSYTLIELSPSFIPLPYLIFMLFVALSLKLLVSNYRVK